eukprot:486759-Prymnesium_polylepis.2
MHGPRGLRGHFPGRNAVSPNPSDVKNKEQLKKWSTWSAVCNLFFPDPDEPGTGVATQARTGRRATWTAQRLLRDVPPPHHTKTTLIP